MKWVHKQGSLILLSLTITATGAFAAQQGSTKPVSKQASSTQSAAKSNESEIARGKYLVEEVARCPDCHTPRDASGALDRSKWLQGGPIWIKPVQPYQNWAERAPALAGFPYTDQQAQNILEKGVGTNGNPIQPPMYVYHMHHADALAIIAYLKSVPAAK